MMKPAWISSEMMKSSDIRVSPKRLARCSCRGGQGERHDIVTARRAESAMAAGADDDILPLIAARPIGHGCGLAARRQFVFPQLAPGLDVKGAQVAVGRGADEHLVAGGGDRPTHVGHTE